MTNKSEWKRKMMTDLYRYKFIEKKTNVEISKILDKSADSIRLKLGRVDWEEFIANPDEYLDDNSSNKKWSQGEMGLMFAYLEDKKSYGFISDKMGRSIVSIERKAQTTDWGAWKASVGNPENPEEDRQVDSETLVAQLVDALVVLSRREFDRLKSITESEFRRKVNFEVDPLPVSFKDITIRADKVLEALGLKNPEEIALGEGTYIIVGDSHGKFTKTQMFELLHQVNKSLKPNKIIHLGHLLDDDNDISYNWGKFKNLIVVSKIEELHLIQDQRNKFDFSYDVVRGCVTLGDDLVVMNQDMITDYVKTPLSSLDAEIFDRKVIVNCHRFEFFPKCTDSNEVSYIASPGALCERHIIRTIKQIDFDDSRTVKQANWEGFSKYRRMQHMYKYWSQGMMVVHVDDKGKHSIIPCVIKKVNKGFATSYFDKIIANDGIHKPTKKIFVTADAHAPNHRNEVLDVQEQVAKDYKADVLVNLGDSADYRTLNHHQMERGEVITGNIVEDSAAANKVLARQSKWAKELHINHGNHERFAMDFIAKFPQLGDLLNFNFLCAVEDLGYKITGMKTPLKVETTTFIHGDMKMFGQTGSKLEKVSKTYGDSVFMGDSHYPAIRHGTFVVGLSGELDQSYNEPNASTWIHGYGLCNHYGGKSFPTTIAIVDDTCIINGKKYVPKDPDSWDLKNYKVQISYKTE